MIDLSNLQPGDGFLVFGNSGDDLAGRSVSSAGDVNGDGIDDLIIGAPGVAGLGESTGAAYVVFGIAGATRANINLGAIAPTDGFRIDGATSANFAGTSVSQAGDVNGDGIDDILVSAPGNDDGGGGAGKTYVIFGATGATRSDISLASLNLADGFAIQGAASFDNLGRSVSNAGDINGDGLDDLIIGAPQSSIGNYAEGAAYVIFGTSGAVRSDIDLSALSASDGFLIQGDQSFSDFGFSVSSAGDINGDGVEDVIIGAPYQGSGTSYVIFGKLGAARADIDIASLDPSDGFLITGPGGMEYAGSSVSSVGDINGDGIDDLAIGAVPVSDGQGGATGTAYIVFGQAGATRTNIDLATLSAADGFVVSGSTNGDNAGLSISAAGDFNNDGVADFIIGAPGHDGGGYDSGAAYLIYGQVGASRTNIDLAALDPGDGIIIQGAAASEGTGTSVSAAGDVNGDGFDDLIIGAPKSDGYSGRSYILFGQAPPNLAPTDIDISNSFIAEDAGVGATVGILTTTDPDVGDSFTYDITGGTGAALFAISGDEVVLSGALDFETASSYTLDIQVTDSGGLTYSEQITVTVTNVAPSVPLDSDGLDNSVSEDAINGALVGITALSSDPGGGSVTYSLSDDAGGRFTIDSELGVVTLADASLIDFESAASHQITVLASDPSGASASSDFTINVTNAAPSVPVDANGAANTLSEGASTGALAGITAFASDPGGGTVTYSLSDDVGGRFAIDSELGVVTLADASLIDFESAASHQITVLASDPSGASASSDFTINVTNAAPSVPVDANGAANTLSEGASTGALVGITAFASDPGGGTVIYSLGDDAGGRFAINSASGVVTLVDASLIDFESAASHQITVLASDPSGAGASSGFTINVANAAPSVPVDVNGAANTLSEGASTGALVGITAFASDPGGGTVIYSLGDDAGGRFAINSASGVVTLADASLIDFESAASHQITVLASDPSGASSSSDFTISIGNEGPSVPVDSNAAANTLSEGAATGAFVGITAASSDSGGGTVTYSLSDDAGGRFTIDSASGVVTLADAALIDFESASSHQITIVASDPSGASASSGFTINVTNAAPSEPVDSDGEGNFLSEGAVNGAGVNITAFASDPGGGTVTYSLSDDAGGRFAIDSASGVVTLADAALIDFESAASHQITILASDPSGAGASSDFTISIGNEGPSVPVDSNAAANSLSEGAATGALVGITASSSDPGGGTVIYSLGDDAGGRFAIDSASGVVTLADASLIDFESADDHQITILASDPSGASASSDFTINVANAAPSVPVDANGAANSLSEGASTGALVGITAFASDPGGGTVIYSLSDNAGGRFAIDSASGVVTLADASLIDFENAASHQITILASDPAGASASSDFTISIGNEGPSVPVDSDGLDNVLSEGAVTGATVNITAFSNDSGGGIIRYSLSDDAGGRFTINSASGVVTLADASLIDFESAASHQITIVAADLSGANASSGFTINVTNAAPSAPGDANLAANTLSEGALTGALVGITASSSDPGGGTVTYSLSNDADGRFAIDGVSGVVTLADASLIDFESATSHQITILASDPSGVDSRSVFTINVTNAAPSMPVDTNNEINILSESASTGARVGITAFASDPGGGAISYSLSDNAGGRFAIDSASGVVTLADASLIDFESAASHQITILASDSSGAGASAIFTVKLINASPGIDLGDFDAGSGFVIAGAGPGTGFAVSAAGDFNGDGFDDAFVTDRLGKTYVILGKAGAERFDIDLGNLSPDDGFLLADPVPMSAVTGDFNGDGTLDSAIFEPAGDSGLSRIRVDLGNDGTGDFDITTNRIDAVLVHAAGDINADGIDDLIVGAPGVRSEHALDAGAVFVIYGKSGESRGDIQLPSFRAAERFAGSDGFVIANDLPEGAGTALGFGGSVSVAGDVNGDGIADIVIGSTGPQARDAFVIFGQSGATRDDLTLQGLKAGQDETAGFAIQATSADFGFGKSVSAAGDINGDGIDDFIIGAPDTGLSGKAYVLFGRENFETVQPFGFVNPLSSLIQLLMDSGRTLAEAEFLIEFAFDIDGTLDLTPLDLAVGQASLPTDLASQQAAAALNVILRTVTDAGGDAASALSAVAALLQGGTRIDLDDFRTIEDILSAGLPGNSDVTIASLAELALSANRQIFKALDFEAVASVLNGGSEVAALSTIVAAEIQSIDAAANALAEEGSDGPADSGDTVSSPAETPEVLPDLAAPDWHLMTPDGFSGAIGGSGHVSGTSGFQLVEILNMAGHVSLDASFNRGGDTLRLHGKAGDWSVARNGTSAVFSDGDTFVSVPVGPVGMAVSFDDGVRALIFDGGQLTIGSQALASGTLAPIAAGVDGTGLPTGADPAAKGVLFLAEDARISVAGAFDINGTSGFEEVHLLAGNITFDPSFNRGGGDTIAFGEAATGFTAVRSGSSLKLVGGDVTALIPVGTGGATLAFGDGSDSRTLLLDNDVSAITVAGQIIGSDPIQLMAI